MRIFKSESRKRIEAHLQLINRQVYDVGTKLTTSLRTINQAMYNGEYDSALVALATIHNSISLYRRSIEMYFTQMVKPAFNDKAVLSLSIKDIQEEKEAVFEWFNEIEKKVEELQRELERKLKNPASIFERYSSLQDSVVLDNRLGKLYATLWALQIEIQENNIRKRNDKLSLLFDNIAFHPIIDKSSRHLFKNGHYAEAIFGACKALILHVRKKSGISTTKDSDLMYQAFGIKYSTNPLTITKKPVLCLNSLNELWEIDEQRGFANLFVGVVAGIRDPKAHADIIQNDAHKTLEYLALLSLLAKRTDETKFNNN